MRPIKTILQSLFNHEQHSSRSTEKISESEFAFILREAKASIVKCDFNNKHSISIIKNAHKRILDDNPTCKRSLAHYGYSLMALGQLYQGEDIFRNTSINHPHCQLAHYFLCLLLYQQGKSSWDNAHREMDQVISGFTDSKDDLLPLEIIADFAAACPTLSGGGLGLVDSRSKKIAVLTTSGRKDIKL